MNARVAGGNLRGWALAARRARAASSHLRRLRIQRLQRSRSTRHLPAWKPSHLDRSRSTLHLWSRRTLCPGSILEENQHRQGWEGGQGPPRRLRRESRPSLPANLKRGPRSRRPRPNPGPRHCLGAGRAPRRRQTRTPRRRREDCFSAAGVAASTSSGWTEAYIRATWKRVPGDRHTMQATHSHCSLLSTCETPDGVRVTCACSRYIIDGTRGRHTRLTLLQAQLGPKNFPWKENPSASADIQNKLDSSAPCVVNYYLQVVTPRRPGTWA